MTAKRIGEILVGAGLLDADQLDAMLQIQKTKKPRQRLGAILIENGCVGETDFYRFLAQQKGLEFVAPIVPKSAPQVTAEIQPETAAALKVFPTAVAPNGAVYVATTEPDSVEAKNQLLHETGKQIEWVISTPTDIQAALDEYYADLTPPSTLPPNLPAGADEEELEELGDEIDEHEFELLEDDLQFDEEELDVDVAADLEEIVDDDFNELVSIELDDEDIGDLELPDVAVSAEGEVIESLDDEDIESTQAEMRNMEAELNELLAGEETAQETTGAEHAPSATPSSSDPELSPLFTGADDSNLELSFEDDDTPPAGSAGFGHQAPSHDSAFDDFAASFEDEDTPPAGARGAGRQIPSRDPAFDDFAASFTDDDTPPSGQDLGDADSALADFLAEEDDSPSVEDSIEGFMDEATPPVGTPVDDMDEALSALLGDDEDEGVAFEEDTPPAGTDIKDMDEELSALLTDEGEDFGASFEDDTPPTGVHVGGNSDQLFASIDDEEEEDRTLVTLRQTDAHTPPTGVQVDKVNEELQLLWDDEDLTEASVEIPLDEADELFETASAEVRILDEESSPTNEAESMDEELLDLFDDAPAAADAEEGVVANGQEPQTSLDRNLPFHKVPWGLMVALKNGLNTEDILTKMRKP